MAKVNTGLCTTCGKERELIYFKLGSVQSTICPFCLHKYLERAVIPRLQRSADESTDRCVIEVYERSEINE